MTMRSVRGLGVVLICIAAACGKDSPGVTNPPPAPPPPPPPPVVPEPVKTPNFVKLQSDPGDWVGDGRAYDYSRENALISMTANGGTVHIGIDGDEHWGGDVELLTSTLQPGTYSGLQRTRDATTGGLSWSGEGRGCNTVSGSVTVDSVTYAAGALSTLDLRFEQHCDGKTAALRGTIHWRADDTIAPPGPVSPPPATLWQPPAGALPASGNYVYLQSDADDYIGAGQTATYTPLNSFINMTALGGRATIAVDGWLGDFQAMGALTQLQPGSYGDLRRYPFHNPVKGGLSWFGKGRACNALTGWFVVDQVTYSAGALTVLELRFEQHCEGKAAALRGAIRWRADDTTAPPGPLPPPSGLWQPPTGSLPATGNYVYLTSEPGDLIGEGKTHTYTPLDFAINLAASGGRATVSVDGWTGDFQAMSTLGQLQPGYYAGLARYPYHNPARGGLSWFGNGRECDTLTGWFVVDQATYSDGALTALDLRFEQHCRGLAPALRGAIHWRADDTSAPTGPRNPPPAGLWQPPAGSLPATGNYIYLKSDPGDYIGAGQTLTFTPHDFFITMEAAGGQATISADGWFGTFQAMSTIGQLQPGYYPDLRRYPSHDPARGGINWYGDGRMCGNLLKGWFVVDHVAYSGGTLTELDLRFEQHCEGDAPALRGAVRWRADDKTQPDGPVNPPPAGLWQPSASALPATGNYVHLQSDPGDWVGQGGTYTYTARDSRIYMTANGTEVSVMTGGWWGDFQAMSTLDRLQPGYYGDLRRHPFHNPARGGLSWVGQGRGCNTLKGWFVVDHVAYSGSTLTELDLRFEQHCEGGAPALHGAIHWRADDPTRPPGPVNPPPAGLWQPAAGSLPAAGNYVYLQSDPGDFIGAGGTYTYTSPDSALHLRGEGAQAIVSTGGWGGVFEPMYTLTQLEPGYYGGLDLSPFNNEARGGMAWAGHGRACDWITGWFVVDHVAYSGGTLTELDLRFEQHCNGSPAALHGAIHWRAAAAAVRR